MPIYEQYEHKGAVFQVSIPMEWDEFDDHLEFNGIKFTKMTNLIGFFEVFSRMDYKFSGVRNAIFVDVGANIADSTLFAAAEHNIKHVYAYEPFPNAYNMAIKNIELNPELKQKIDIYPYGWFNKKGILSIDETIDINSSAINSTLPEFMPNMKHNELHKTKIELKRASDILKEIITKHPDNPIILKMDIEGAEYECFKELDKSQLLNSVKIIFVEWHKKDSKTITDILEKHNFVWFNEKLGSNVGLIRAVHS